MQPATPDEPTMSDEPDWSKIPEAKREAVRARWLEREATKEREAVEDQDRAPVLPSVFLCNVHGEVSPGTGRWCPLCAADNGFEFVGVPDGQGGISTLQRYNPRRDKRLSSSPER